MTVAASSIKHPHFTALYSQHHSWLQRWLCRNFKKTKDKKNGLFSMDKHIRSF